MNNQSKKSECIGVMIICGLCEKPFCNGCFKGCPDCHSSQDLEGECKLCLKLKGACPLCTRKGASITLEPKPVSEKKCEEKGYHTGYHTSQEPVSEGKEKSQPFQCFQFGCWIAPEGIIHKKECKYNVDTPPSNALRSEEWEEDFDQQFLQEVILDQEVRTVVKGIKLFITKLLTSERQREYLRGCKDENIISKDLCELARADERKKMGELIKKFCESKSWKEDAGNEVVQLEDILDYLSKLVKPQDK